MASDRTINLPTGFFHPAPNQCDIFFLHGSVFELKDEILISRVCLRYDHDAGSIFIQPVNDARPTYTSDTSKVRAPMNQCVNESSRPMTCSRVDRDPRCLIDDNAVQVLVQDVQRQRFGSDRRVLRRRNRNHNRVGGT